MNKDFVELMIDKLLVNGFVVEAKELKDIYSYGATSTEKLIDVGNYLNEISKKQEINSLISNDVKFFNDHMKSIGIGF